MSDGSSAGQTYKVGRVIDEYDLAGWGAELERRWVGEGGESESLRSLADDLNRAVLRSALVDAGQQPVDGEVRNTYRLLTDDDVSSGDRTQLRRSLERQGVDVEQVERDFVTHQAVHTYLRKGRGAEKETDDGNRAERVGETIQRLRSRTVAVTESSLEQLRNAGELTLGDFSVLVSVTVVCSDCGTQQSVTDLLDAGGCDCDSD